MAQEGNSLEIPNLFEDLKPSSFKESLIFDIISVRFARSVVQIIKLPFISHRSPFTAPLSNCPPETGWTSEAEGVDKLRSPLIRSTLTVHQSVVSLIANLL